MNIFKLLKKYGTQSKCLTLLEKTRWGNTPRCPYCEGDKVSRKTEKNRHRRWQCSRCRKSFSVTVGTIFHNTQLELPYWFAILNLMLNAKKSISSYQISRDIGIRQGTVHSIQNRIRKAMSEDQGELLWGIVEMDETYIGGKPRKANFRKNDELSKRGRGTDKLPVIGAVERGGNVIAKVVKGTKLSFQNLKTFVESTVNTKAGFLVTDDYKSYNSMAVVLPHSVVNHSIAYSFHGVHTNTIESFWALLKRAWYGQHHHYSKLKAHLYVAESCYKYNNRKNKNTFKEMIKKMVGI